ncbi:MULTISPECIES: cytochrome P450 [Rhodococcus]|uniref:cytochrome P450 n=1 Tax=Rhodococcus TaxID=1827 RepID=UPI000B5A7F4E|nr:MULTISPECIES: cytochrome P450 [Rhodococcus]MXQ75212.1 cytochrome P450 [Rhodococcus rhodochrous]OWY81572.1 cytochrome P450 [Rhodococcus sp. BUPNP1]BDB62415.1 cytochrome P450 [Rhodococcus sp. RDE2]
MTKMLAPPPPGLAPVPGDSGLPYVGYALKYMRDPIGAYTHRYHEHGPVSWFRFAGRPWVVLLGPDAVGAALQNRDRALLNGPGWRALIGPFFDRGLMLLDGDEHTAHRRIMSQAFTRDRLSLYTDRMHPSIERTLDGWTPRDDFRVYPALKELTLGLATEIFMGGAEGSSAREMDEVNRAFIGCVQAATAIVRYPLPGTRWRRGIVGRARLEKFFRHYLPARRAGDGDDIFSVFCHVESEEGERFSDDDVVNHMIFLMMAAHDTSTITLSTAMQYLGQFPEWQQRCRDESDALGTTTPSFDRLDELTSLDLVIKECQRLVTPVPGVVRRAAKDTEILGHFVPKGTLLNLGMHFSHHMPELWPDPERFDPERFSPERREDKVHKYAWAPFGGGAHRCLGMHFSGAEIKTVLHHLLLRFRWHVPADYVAPMNFTSLPFPNDGGPIHLLPR